jgi:hypothetical protein
MKKDYDFYNFKVGLNDLIKSVFLDEALDLSSTFLTDVISDYTKEMYRCMFMRDFHREHLKKEKELYTYKTAKIKQAFKELDQHLDPQVHCPSCKKNLYKDDLASDCCRSCGEQYQEGEYQDER